MNQNGGIHKGGFAVLCHRNGGSESPGILTYGRLSRYANSGLMEKEVGAMERALINKHEETDFYLQ